MVKEKIIGSLICIGSLFAIVFYGWLLFASDFSLLVLQITAFVAVALILGILAFIGYTLATTPSFKPEVEREEKEKP